MFYLFTVTLFVFRASSAAEIFLVTAWLMMICVVIFAVVVARSFRSTMLSVGIMLFSVVLFDIIALFDIFVYTRLYVWPLYLLLVGMLAVAFVRRVHLTPIKAVLLFAFLGMLGGLTINMRSTYIMQVMAAVLIYVAFVVVNTRKRGGSIWPGGRWLVVPPAAAFVVGIALFQFVFIRPIQRVPVEGYSQHLIAHPLVLGLAVPESELSKREGIEWADTVGLDLARRADPSVRSYWDPKYESALMQYYRALWNTQPGEMTGLYLRKGNDAGLWEMKLLRRIGVGWVSPFSVVRSGYFIVALLFAIMIVGVVVKRKMSGASILLVLLGSLGVSEYLQSAVIYPGTSYFFPGLVFALAFYTIFVWLPVERLLSKMPLYRRVSSVLGG